MATWAQPALQELSNKISDLSRFIHAHLHRAVEGKEWKLNGRPGWNTVKNLLFAETLLAYEKGRVLLFEKYNDKSGLAFRAYRVMFYPITYILLEAANKPCTVLIMTKGSPFTTVDDLAAPFEALKTAWGAEGLLNLEIKRLESGVEVTFSFPRDEQDRPYESPC